MKLGRFVVQDLDGPVHRLCMVLPQQQRVIDLRAAEILRQMDRGASREAAQRYASTVFPSSMSAAIALGEQFLETAAEAAARRGDDASLSFDGLVWGAACDPSIVRDGLTFTKHIRQFHERMKLTPAPALLQVPGYFKGSPWTVIGHDAEVPWPARAERMDYELELGWVIGRGANDITPDVPVAAGDAVLVTQRLQKFIALGAVAQPGEQIFRKSQLTLADGLGQAFGLDSQRSDAKGVYLFRREPVELARRYGVPLLEEDRDTVPIVYQLDLKDGKSFFVMNQFPIRPNDIVFVSTAPLAEAARFFQILSGATATVAIPRTLGGNFPSGR